MRAKHDLAVFSSCFGRQMHRSVVCEISHKQFLVPHLSLRDRRDYSVEVDREMKVGKG
jgi:hypothetical protein